MKTVFAKYNSQRLPEFQLITKISKNLENKIFVHKESAHPSAKEHLFSLIEKYYKHRTAFPSISLSAPVVQDEKVLFEHIEGINLKNLLFQYIEVQDYENVRLVLNGYFDLIESCVGERNVIFSPCNEFESIFGKWSLSKRQDVISYPNIDLIFGNIIVKEAKMYIVDYEWIFDFPVPKNYIIARALIEFANSTNFDILNYYDLSKEEISQFMQMESALYDYIFGKNRSHAFTDKIIKKQVKVADLETEISILKNKINELKNNLQITQDESSHFHDLAQSMRLKNRLKRMTPKFIRKFLSQKR
jgi:hypothetical protein